MSRDPAVTSRIMAAVRNRDTKPEIALRRVLWRRGLRYRVHAKLIGKPDLAFLGPRLAVFVDGDFWHGNAWRVRGLPNFDAQFHNMNNAEFWRAKISQNIARDQAVNTELQSAAWTVYRVFESQLNSDLERVADQIESLVRAGNKGAGTVAYTSLLQGDECRGR
ncbi:very short patch repair endonuclease [Micromonospora psammae]|uniref:very short patch repair endonuclease n=1 Tax=Micromonospora sp. CPCC 205556 TaxID=3122398 RepID=UPI002FF188E0